VLSRRKREDKKLGHFYVRFSRSLDFLGVYVGIFMTYWMKGEKNESLEREHGYLGVFGR